MNSTATATPVLTTIASRFMQEANGFAALALFPIAPTALEAAAYYVADVENALDVPTNIERAPGAVFSRTTTRLSDDRFRVRLRGHEEAVPRELLSRYASKAALKRAVLRRVIGVMLMNHEMRVKALVTSGDVSKAAPGVKWNDAGSNPVDDVGPHAVRFSTGAAMIRIPWSFPALCTRRLNRTMRSGNTFALPANPRVGHACSLHCSTWNT